MIKFRHYEIAWVFIKNRCTQSGKVFNIFGYLAISL